MNGRTYAYLDLVALPAVGPVLLDPRPAFVFSGDGAAVLWANVAGAAFLGERTIANVLERHFTGGSPFARHLARLAKLLPVDRSRLEILRFSFGVTQRTLACACQRLNLAGGQSAVLAVGTVASGHESIVTRSEELADAIAGRDCLAAVLSAEGRVLGATGGFSELGPASAAIDELVRSVAGAKSVAKRVIDIDGEARPAGAAHFEAGGDSFSLLIVGPGQRPAASTVARPARAPYPPQRFESEFDIARELDGIVPQPPSAAPPEHTAGISTAKAVLGTGPAPADSPVPAKKKAEEEVFLDAESFGGDEAGAPADLDDVARISIERGLRPGSTGEQREAAPPREPTRPPAAEPPRRSNVVRLPGLASGPARAAPAEPLTGAEHDAFRRIAEALGAHRPADQQSAPEAVVGAPSPAGEAPSPEARPEELLLLDRVPVGLVVIREGRTIFANRMLLDMLGYGGPAEFTAAGGAESLFPGEAANWSERGPEAQNSPMTARRRDGATFPVEVRLHSVPWGSGSALMLSLRDASTATTKPPPVPPATAEAQPFEGRVAELETILDTATDGVIVIDGLGRIDRLNSSAEALFGIEGRQVLGQRFTDLLADESRKAALDYLDGLASNGVASVLNDGREVIGKVPQGGLIPLFMTMGRLGDTGKFCAVLRDITQWKNAEEELVAAKRAAEQANQQKSDFLAKISHEIRTPLNAIIGFSEVMIEERFGPIGNERYRDYLRDIHVSGAHLMSLINDLLDLSKIEAGKLDLAFESVAVNAVIQECVALMQPQANRQRIIIRTSLSASVPNVVADPRSLRQILLNLLSNAVKFTGAGGQVIVSTALEDRGEVVIRVRDTGIGMSEKDIETALKPFRQLATTNRERGEGTGLGLPLTKALVEANRATFSIDSAVNQGTLVRIIFPTTRVLAG